MVRAGVVLGTSWRRRSGGTSTVDRERSRKVIMVYSLGTQE